MGHQNQVGVTILESRHGIIDLRCIPLRYEGVQRFRFGARTAFENALCGLGGAAPPAEQYSAGQRQIASLKLQHKTARASLDLSFTPSGQRAVPIR